MSCNRSAFGTYLFAFPLAFAVAVPAGAVAGNKPAAQLADSAGNTYGVTTILGPDNLGGDRLDPLRGIVRAANALQRAKGGEGHRGLAIRLKPHSGGGCGQIMRGTDQSNLLDGSQSACDETLMGMGGDDILIGGAGLNSLDGGKGADVMTGGGSADRFVYERASDSAINSVDSITDFNARDLIDLSGLARTAGVTLTYIGWQQFTGVAGQVNYNIMEYWKCDAQWHCVDAYLTVVGVDLTGSGAADFAIDLLGRHHPTAANFALKPR